MAHTAEEWFQIGVEKYADDLYEEAIEAFDKFIRLDPNHSVAYCFRGLAKFDLKEITEAVIDFDQAIRLNPKNTDAYCFRGPAMSLLGDNKAAIADLDQAIRIDPNDAEAYNNRGYAKFKLRLNKDAKADFDQAIHLNPNFAEAYFNRGTSNSAMSDYYAAISDYNEAIRFNPNDAISYKNRGAAQYNLKHYIEAIADFDQAIDIDPSLALAYLNRGLSKESLGKIHSAQLDFRCFLHLTDQAHFFENSKFIFDFYQDTLAPYLLCRTLEKFTKDLDQFNTLHPITDTTRQQCRPWKRWEEWRKLSGTENHDPLAHNHALALVNHYMGDCIEAFRIYDEILDDERVMGVPLNLMGLYYYIESAKLFRQPHEVILEDAIEQIEETRGELIENNALRELYYAGQILWANDQLMEAQEFFELADEYLPAAYMQLLTLPTMGADDEDLQTKIADIREREAELLPSEGFLQGFPAQSFRLEKPGEDFLAPVLHYAHYREIAQAIAEVRDPGLPFEHHEMWDAFYWKPEDEKELDWLLRRERLAEINKALLEKFKANVQSGSGVHSLEHLETAFAKKLKHDLWEGTQYLGFEDFKSKIEAWPNAAREVATFIRDSRRLDANSKLLLVEYCYLRDNLNIEDTYLLYFYISYVITAQDSGIASEVNSAAVKKVVELVLAPISITGKVLTAAAGGAIARLFKLYLSDSSTKDQINMEEFQNPRSPQPDDFEAFCTNFLRFINYQRETLGREAFEKQYPLEGFKDRSRK